jgi:hypothetical protein
MGGGGGFDPVSIIGNMVFGSVLGSVAQDAAGSRALDTAAAASAEAEQQAAEARQKADRKKAEAALLAKARQAERANAAQDDAQSGTTNSLGGASGVSGASASLTAGQLKARLGQ